MHKLAAREHVSRNRRRTRLALPLSERPPPPARESPMSDHIIATHMNRWQSVLQHGLVSGVTWFCARAPTPRQRSGTIAQSLRMPAVEPPHSFGPAVCVPERRSLIRRPARRRSRGRRRARRRSAASPPEGPLSGTRPQTRSQALEQAEALGRRPARGRSTTSLLAAFACRRSTQPARTRAGRTAPCRLASRRVRVWGVRKLAGRGHVVFGW